MFIENIEKVKSPIVYITLSFMMSSVFYGIFNEYIWLAFFSASLFFIFIFLNTNKEFSVIIFVLFIIGIVINSNYYRVNLEEKFIGTVRVVEEKSYYNIVEYNGKRVKINSKESLELGDKANISGVFKKDINKEDGTVGTIEIENQKIFNKDILGNIYSIRKTVYDKLKENLGQRKAALVSSLAFGYSEFLDSEDKDDMRNLGIIHAISVSGLHVSIIFLSLKKLFGNKFAIVLSCLYVILTGIPFSSLRALIMIVCSSSSISLRKSYNPLGGLSLSALIIILLKPYAIFQLGFILSFGATLGIILFSNKISRYLYKLPKYISSTIAISIGAQAFTLPVMIIAFREFSMWFLIGNILVIPILNFIIILGNLGMIISFIPPIFDFLSFILLKSIDLLDYLIEELYAFSNTSFISHKSLAIIYMSMLISFYFIYKGYKKFFIFPIVSFFCVSIFIYSPFLKFEYLREGGLLLSYRGERTIVTNKRNIDIGKLKKENLAQSSILEGKNIRISDNIKLKSNNKNFILKLNRSEYLLRINNRSKVKENCDIIDFVEGNVRGFIIFDNKIFTY